MTKKCQNCDENIPIKTKFKGKIIYLSGRKFCTKCSPLNGRNTRSYVVKMGKNEAFCSRCQHTKKRDEFYIRKNSGKPLSYCMECQNEVKQLKLKEKLNVVVEMRGGACQDCEIIYPIQIFEFYSNRKKYNLSKLKNMSLERFQKETKDHLMLCKNCCAMREWEEEN